MTKKQLVCAKCKNPATHFVACWGGWHPACSVHAAISQKTGFRTERIEDGAK